MPPKKVTSDNESSEDETDIDDDINETDDDDEEDADKEEDDQKSTGDADGKEETEMEASSATGENDDCMYNFKENNIIDEEEFNEVFDDDNMVFDEVVPENERITKPVLSIYERVRIIGDRARQLLEGAKPMIKGAEKLNPKEIARLELDKGVLPFKIVRELPNGKKEIWRLKEFVQVID